MEKERIAILKAELEAQVGEIEKIYVRLDERSKKKGKAAAESIGYQLHNLYCAFEDLFESWQRHLKITFTRKANIILNS